MNEQQAPVLAHIHVPKCAGTAFRSQLNDYYGPSHLDLYCNNDTFFVYSEQEMAGFVADPNVKAFSSHFFRTFPALLAGRKLLYVTFLRDPVEQFVSYLTYVRKHFDSLQGHPQLMSCLPPDLPLLSLRESALWILTSPRDVNFRENFAVNFFAKFPYQQMFGAPCDAASEVHYRRTRLSVAKIVLDSFFMVGATEQMNRSAELLKDLAELHGIFLPAKQVSVENVSREGRDDLRWLTPGDPVGSLLLQSVIEDQLLYRYALARLDQSKDMVRRRHKRRSLVP